jgi:predicted nuclease of restriction endonuclease-like (RecB) superfamily
MTMAKGSTALAKKTKVSAANPDSIDVDAPTFAKISELISDSRVSALRSVNTVLIDLYWKIGEIVSRKLEASEWGDGVVLQLAAYIARRQPGLRGFTRVNLFRMRQFYETYKAKSIVSAPLRQLSWTHHLIIISQCKRAEERDFYVRTSIQQGWSSRQLERQIKAALFERVALSPATVSAALRQSRPEAVSIFRDTYMLEFLGLPQGHSEADLHRSLILKLKDFLLELGPDFCFVRSEHPLQVGGRDFALDLLSFHRGLNCLVAFELKVGRFEPEYLGKLEFYLEALDRDVRKSHERPAIGVLLCAGKDKEVVEYALSRTLSPALIAEYRTKLPDKKLLQSKLHRFYLENTRKGSPPERLIAQSAASSTPAGRKVSKKPHRRVSTVQDHSVRPKPAKKQAPKRG